MKTGMKVLMLYAGMILTLSAVAQESKIDSDKMDRDIEVGENILSTLIRQKLERRNFFPMDVDGNYNAGYGVTFKVHTEVGGQLMLLDGGPKIRMNSSRNGSYSYSYSVRSSRNGKEKMEEDCEDCDKKPKAKIKKVSLDSVSVAFSQAIIDASKDFLADYGDLISQLSPSERILVTNRDEGQRFWVMAGDNSPKRFFISVEATKGDITQYHQGKLSRDQLFAKMQIVNSETSSESDPDLELLSSIFNRLYKSDLSKTFYTEEDVYYERLKDFGAIFYMHAYSSSRTDRERWNMPTADLDDVDQATRDKKVIELYPAFEQSVKENMLDYGRTVKSLKDNEVLVLQIKVTECKKCGIPSSLELSVKDSVLKDFNSGKLSREAAMAKMTVKKGAAQ
jgi:hypothetical protein